MVAVEIMEKVEVITAIVGIVILEAIALSKGINGVLLTTIIAIIAGIAGYEFKTYRHGDNNDEFDVLEKDLME